MSLVAEQEKQADALAAAVWALYAAAVKSVGWFGDNAVKANLEELATRIERWSGEMRTWAQAGVKPEGLVRTFSYTRWSELGRELGLAATYHAKVDLDTGALFIIKGALRETSAKVEEVASQVAADVGAVANIGSWGVGTKLLMGLGLAVAGIVAVRSFFR